MDPVTVDSVGGNFNRYWYANNNPYRFTDPDGRSPQVRPSVNSQGPIDCDECEVAPRPAPSLPPPTTLETVVVTPPRDHVSEISFFQLTTFAALRRDMSSEEAIEAGELTRTVTLPALVVTASPSALALLGTSAAPMGEVAIAGVRYAGPAARAACLAAGASAAFCNGKGDQIAEDLLERTRQRHELVEGMARETRDRAGRQVISP